MEQINLMTKRKMVLADFDDTLINCDSLVTIMKQEKWYLDIAMIISGAKIVLAKLLRGDEYRARSNFKYIMMGKYEKLSEEKKKAYIEYLKNQINEVLIEQINQIEPDKIVIASASSKELIGEVMSEKLNLDIIVANEFSKSKAEFKTCFGQEKAARFCEAVPDYMDYDIYVFSDSFSDQPIFELGYEKYMVKKSQITRI